MFDCFISEDHDTKFDEIENKFTDNVEEIAEINRRIGTVAGKVY